ncbi:MAG TPA: two-component regulator propeller domain-containing protein [Segetibacter sp.]|jgi:signal transduction histidine kinase
MVLKTDFLHIKARRFPLLILLLLCGDVTAQAVKEFSSQSYTVNEGLLVNKVVDIVEDNSGFIWLSSGAGLQRFNGQNFETIEPQKGLPQNNHTRFFKLKDGTIWLSYNQGISSYNSITNKFQTVLKNADKDLKQLSHGSVYGGYPQMPVIEIGNLVWCRSVFTQGFIGINKSNYAVSDTFNLPKNLIPRDENYKKSPTGTIFFNSNKGFAEVDFKNKKVQHLYRFPDAANIIFNFYPLTNNKLLLLTSKGMFMADVATGVTEFLSHYPPSLDPKKVSNISLNHLYQNLFVAGIGNELYVLDAESGKFLYRMVNQQGKPFVSPWGYINSCMMDDFNHLWVVSQVEGLKKINFTQLQIKYYGVADMQKNVTRCIYADKAANLVITGTLFNGISVFDTAGHLIKQFSLKLPPHRPFAQVNSILKIAPFKYLIFVPSEYSVYLLDAVKWNLTPVSKTPEIAYYSTIQPIADNVALLLHTSGLMKVNHRNQKTVFEPLLSNRSFLCAWLDTKQQLWAGATGKYSILKGKNFEEETVVHLKENLITRCFLQDKAGFMWMGTEAGLYKLNANTGAVLRIYKKTDGLADETIYSLLADEANNIWFSTNKGISCLTADDNVVNIYASDGLQGSEFNGNSAAKSEDGELFFGGLNGVNSFDPGILTSIEKKPKIVMSNIKVMEEDWRGDTASWNLTRIKLPYTQNVISFSFIAKGWYNPDVYNYQYKMIGIDKDWVNAGNTGNARYILPPGKYTFEYTASSRFNKDISYKKFIYIVITPPFWQTGLFKAFAVLSLAVLLIALVRIYDKQKFKKQLLKLEIQQTVQQERQRISRDLHDNIGAHTTALIASVEQLHKKAVEKDVQQSAESVSENAKNIIGSLRETVWVLNKNAITITNFADRFILYAQKMLQNYPDVQRHFQEDLIKDITLTPVEALNIFRIMQEALQNALKHGNPKNISVLINSNDVVHVSVKDDGKGFDTASVVRGNGLYNMKYRAKEAGYELKILSDINGTEIILQKKYPS